MKIDEYLRTLPKEVIADLTTAEGRIRQTKDKPLLFAVLYMRRHITNEAGVISLSEFHLALDEYAKTWMTPLAKQMDSRDAFIAPRNAGKSTWLFTILPMWAAAHGHIRFVAAFADSASQSEEHLQTFKTELDSNEALQEDFPELCTPLYGKRKNTAVAQSRDLIRQANGFSFIAKGADSKTLGMKIGDLRPQLILFDDIEPQEANYSENEALKRRGTVLNAILPMNINARVVFAGTTTMPGSIIDQLRMVEEKLREWREESDFSGIPGELQGHHKSGTNEFNSNLSISTPFSNTENLKISDPEFYDSLDPDLRWVLDERIRVHYFPVVLKNADGSERSLWPEFWSMEYINAYRHTRSFAMNLMNKPVSVDAAYWQDADIRIGEPAGGYGNTLLVVDPAVTTKKRSDYTGISIESRGLDKDGNDDGFIYVRYAEQHKITPGPELRDLVSDLCKAYGAKVVLVESNMGGDVWRTIFDGIPAKLRLERAVGAKETRANQALDFYQRGKVFHRAHFETLVTQMRAFPRVTHDDVVDSVCTGVLYFLGKPQVQVSIKSQSYV
ncbi:phage terminase large subunit family protein [Streptomyces parvulus]|uniref:phage terminase large subunit family protein n=1 Tax=Streptomyces parvulus TaxID=146923 RepID=UPI0036B39C89